MKKTILTLAAVLCCAVCTQAQENKDYEVTITPIFVTELLLDEKNSYSPKSMDWTGEGLHAGHQRAGMEIAIERDNKIPEVPENPLLEISLTDAYDKVAFIEQNTNYLTGVFEEDLLFTRHFHDKHTLGRDVQCGGEYIYRIAVPRLDYLYEEKVVVKDEPYARVRYYDVKDGSDLLAVAFFNTGYPYDPTSLSGTEEATMQLFYIDKNEQGETTETEVAKVEGPIFRDQTGPLLACYDSLKLGYANPKPGEYRLKLSSNWQQEGANRDDIIINVEAPAAIRSARSDMQATEEATYTLGGIRVDSHKPHSRDIYIRNGKKISIN